jgi:hypothetical protein
MHIKKTLQRINTIDELIPNKLQMSVDLLHSTISDVIKTANCTVLTVSEKLELSEQRLYKLIDSIQDIIVFTSYKS